MKRLWQVLGILSVVAVLVLGLVAPVFADELEDELERLTQEIEEIQAKLDDVREEKQSLSSDIQFLNNKILLNEKEVEKTEFEIRVLEAQVDDLSQRIDGLKTSLSELSETLINRVQTQYKTRTTDPISMIFATTGLSDFFKEYKYYERVRTHTQELLLTTELKRQVYDEEKTNKEDKQVQMEALQRQLSSQQAELRQQEEAKQRLLTQTRNSEATYSRLLEEAKAELNSLSRFSSNRQTEGVLPPQNSPDGWYFSQRDERWANNCVGLSCDYSIFDVGCLVASTAMVKKKMGENVTPLSIAGNPSYFFSTTAYMLRPYPAPSGYTYNFSAYDSDLIDRELEAGRPVIAKLSVSTQYSTHFIVLKDGRDGDYIMHDPWEGYDLKFNDYYSTGQILTLAYLR